MCQLPHQYGTIIGHVGEQCRVFFRTDGLTSLDKNNVRRCGVVPVPVNAFTVLLGQFRIPAVLLGQLRIPAWAVANIWLGRKARKAGSLGTDPRFRGGFTYGPCAGAQILTRHCGPAPGFSHI